MNKNLALIAFLVVLIGVLKPKFNIQQVQADYTWSETIYIRADGSVEPAGAPISTADNITYTLTDNIVGDIPRDTSAIIIERDNIVLDGTGYTLQNTHAGYSSGMSLFKRSNVTIRDVRIKHFSYGVHLLTSSNNIIGENNITDNYMGVYLEGSSNNIIVGNNIANNGDGVRLDGFSRPCNDNNISHNNMAGNGRGIIICALSSCNDNNISYNNITANEEGIYFYGKSNENTIRGNYIANNSYGLRLAGPFTFSNGVPTYRSKPKLNLIQENSIENNREAGVKIENSSDNIFYHNNFLNNTIQIHSVESTNTWDNGYPSGGNFWSDYNGTDTNNDGMGDTPYVIDEKNKDGYPLMNPWTPSEHEPVTPAAPLWMQWWLWIIAVVVIVALAGAVYLIKKRKLSTPSASAISTEDASRNIDLRTVADYMEKNF